jgi:hypothetical protein
MRRPSGRRALIEPRGPRGRRAPWAGRSRSSGRATVRSHPRPPAPALTWRQPSAHAATATLRVRVPGAGQRVIRDTGCVGAEHAFSGISWTALTLEVGKSPTEVSPGKGGCRWHLGRRFASSLRRRAQKLISPNRAVLSTTLGRQHGELQNQRSARATRSLGACATRPDHAVDMLAEERLCKRHPGWRSIHAAPRLCAPELSYLISYPTAGSSARDSRGCARHCRQLCQSLTEHSNLACRLRPATAQSPGGGRTCVSSYGVSWGLGKLKFVRLA